MNKTEGVHSNKSLIISTLISVLQNPKYKM